MSISIITPHFNDFEGIQRIYQYLLEQSSKDWEWIIVDDCSDESEKTLLNDFFEGLNIVNIKLILNEEKSNASVCRNIGVTHAVSQRLVFLDSDDKISSSFVRNRLIEVENYKVFKNTNIIDEYGISKPVPTVNSDYLDCFLKAKFIWPITSILWNKDFFIKLGGFDKNLKRLQDIELSLKALLTVEKIEVLNNEVDFYYRVFPIDPKKRPLSLICDSVDYLIINLLSSFKLSTYQRHLLQGYYYLCVRYFYKSNSKSNISRLIISLKLFREKRIISFFKYIVGMLLIFLFRINFLSIDFFLKINRYYFK